MTAAPTPTPTPTPTATPTPPTATGTSLTATTTTTTTTTTTATSTTKTTTTTAAAAAAPGATAATTTTTAPLLRQLLPRRRRLLLLLRLQLRLLWCGKCVYCDCCLLYASAMGHITTVAARAIMTAITTSTTVEEHFCDFGIVMNSLHSTDRLAQVSYSVGLAHFAHLHTGSCRVRAYTPLRI